MKRVLAILLCVLTLVGTLAFGAAADDFSATLAQFPDSYKASLTALHKAHPNWVFKRVSVGKNFSVCLNAEHNCKAQECTVLVDSAKDPKACQADCPNAKYHLISDGTRCASYDYVAECMDPTNFLRESLIFQFEYLNAKSYYTKDKLEKVLDAAYSFMHQKTCKLSGKTYYYSQIILDACKTYNVDALFIISRITNEVGALYPVKLARGYEYKGKTVYNFFSIGAYPTTDASGKVITAPENGAKTAYNNGWTNPKAALEGGIKFIAEKYIKAGQYTNYFQKYQVNPNSKYDLFTHQYMQGVEAIIDESGYTYEHYNNIGVMGEKHVFYLPVYENLSKVDYEAQDVRFRNAADSTGYAYVNSLVSSELSLRSGAGSSYTKIAGIKRGVLLSLIGKSGAWYKVKALNGAQKGKSGYVKAAYVNPAPRITVTEDNNITLKPKLRVSTCTYALAYESVKAAVSINKSGVAHGNQKGTSVYQAKTSAGNIGYVEIACTGAIPAPAFSLSGGNRSVKVSWKAVSGAAYYRVYTYNTSTKKYARIAQTTGLSYTHKSLKDAAKYTYLVRAFDADGGSKYTTASNKSVYTLPQKPVFKASALTGMLTLSWSKAAGAEKYGIWRYDAKTNSYTKLANTTHLSYDVKGLKGNTKYTFLVRSYNAKSGWSAFTRADNKSIYTAPAAPTVTAKGGEKAIRLTWNKIANAAFYRVYVYNPTTKKYTRIAQTTALTYKITALAKGTQYTYLVRAFRDNASGSSYGVKNHVSALTIPAKPAVKAEVNGTSVRLSWSKVKSAQRYGIWSYNVRTGAYKKLANTTLLQHEIHGLTAGREYIYLVRAYNATGWNKFTVKDNIKVKI
ncbi:MAG: SH3 domain-containing protein [Clostridia bacterium]|nr:SH3 domain-containing protein [Clostridia bacterium]